MRTVEVVRVKSGEEWLAEALARQGSGVFLT
jgi:hypothetical protein